MVRKILSKEGLIALLFLSIIIILALGPWGILTIPGYIAAIIGIWAILKNKPELSALMGIAAAAGSFIGQSITAFCPYCTAGASLFAIAGLLALIPVISKNRWWVLLSTPLLAALLVFVGTFTVQDSRTFAYSVPEAEQETIENIGNIENIENSKPHLYIVISCKSCKETLDYFIAKDPAGEKWHPVIIPNSALASGEEMLKEKGYTGTVSSSGSSPGKAVPCLLHKDQVYVGAKQIIKQAEIIFGKGK